MDPSWESAQKMLAPPKNRWFFNHGDRNSPKFGLWDPFQIKWKTGGGFQAPLLGSLGSFGHPELCGRPCLTAFGFGTVLFFWLEKVEGNKRG